MAKAKANAKGRLDRERAALDTLDAEAAERLRNEAASLAARTVEESEIRAGTRLIPRGKPGLRRPNPQILEIVQNLAQIQCTTVEAGLVFGVTGAAFRDWLEQYPRAKTAWEAGRGEGLVSLRRAQYAAALAGDSRLLIWLGKQYLDQQDRVLHGGDSTQPIVVQWQIQHVQHAG